MINLLNIFSSSNRFFYQSLHVLTENRKNVDLFLQLKGYELSERSIYLKAYDHMVQFPHDFNGASMTEDLPDIGSLELAAMLHDYLYINFKVSGSFKYSWWADKLLRLEMRRMGKSSWNTGTRMVLLILKAPFFVPFTYLFKNRRMNDYDKTKMEIVYSSLNLVEPKVWYREFKGELTWSLIIAIVTVGYIWRISPTDFIELLKLLFI